MPSLISYFNANRLEFSKKSYSSSLISCFNKVGSKSSSIRKKVSSKSQGSLANVIYKEFRIFDGRVRPENISVSSSTFNNKYTSPEFRCDGVNSVFLGRHPIRLGSRPAAYYKPPAFANFIYNKYKATFDSYGLFVDRAVIVSGSFSTNRHTLQQQAIPEVAGDFSNLLDNNFIRKFDNIVKVCLRKIRPTILHTCDKDSMFYTKFDGTTKPGFRFEHVLKYKDKNEACSTAIDVAKRKWNYIEKVSRKAGKLNRLKMYPGIYSIGARSKRDYEYENGDYAKSRVVHMPEFHSELHAAPWVDQITDHIIERSNGPIYIGNSFVKYERLDNDLKNCKFCIEGDWKRFDSTIYLNMITIATAILRTFYKQRDIRIDNHFIGIYDTLSIKDYYLPGGNIFRLFHGLPSGVKSTNLLGTIINLLALLYCIQDFNDKEFSFATGGDDFLVIYNGDNADVDDVIAKMYERSVEIGMEFKFLECKKHNDVNVDMLPVFFKYSVYNGLPIIPSKYLLERISMPWAKQYKTNEEYFDFIKTVMPSLCTPNSTSVIYYDLYSQLHNILFRNSITISSVFLKHTAVSNKVLRNKIIYNSEIYQKRLITDIIKESSNKYQSKIVFEVFS